MKPAFVILAALCFRSLLPAQAIPLTSRPAKRCSKAKYTVNMPVSKAYKIAMGYATESGLKLTGCEPGAHEFAYREPVVQEVGHVVVSRKVSVRLRALGPSCTQISAKRSGPRLPENLSKQWQHIIEDTLTAR